MSSVTGFKCIVKGCVNRKGQGNTVDIVSLRIGLKKANIICTDILTEEQIRQALLSME